MNLTRLIVISIVLLRFFYSSFAYADISATLSLEPINPLPNSSVTINIDSYSFDVNTAFISWKIGGKTVLEGMGKKDLIVRTGGIGASTEVVVTAKTASGDAIEQKITITPSSVLLLYEAPKSYVPLLYPGKSLPSDGAVVRITALPQISDNGTPLPPSSLSFIWYLNDEVLQDISGTGKQSANIRLDYMEEVNEIKVIVRSPLGNSGTKTIPIYTHTIMPLLYQYNPVLGTNFTALASKRFETTEDFSLILEPFYISYNESIDPVFEWYLDGLPSTPLGGRILSLHPKEDSYGSKMLHITLTGPDSRIQNAETSLEILFDTRK